MHASTRQHDDLQSIGSILVYQIYDGRLSSAVHGKIGPTYEHYCDSKRKLKSLLIINQI